MNNQKRSRLVLLVAGLLFMGVVQIVAHFITLPDLLSGILVGMGLGIAIVGIVRLKRIPGN